MWLGVVQLDFQMNYVSEHFSLFLQYVCQENHNARLNKLLSYILSHKSIVFCFDNFIIGALLIIFWFYSVFKNSCLMPSSYRLWPYCVSLTSSASIQLYYSEFEFSRVRSLVRSKICDSFTEVASWYL